MPRNTRTNRLNECTTAHQPIRQFNYTQSNPKLVKLSAKDNKKCMFCGRKNSSEKLYGFLFQLDDIVVHHFCILLSSESIQNGDDHEGIWGFLLKDIKAELTRGSKKVCVYCKNPGATISCSGGKCRKSFHLPCGLKKGSMHQYFGYFKSFCQQHRKKQKHLNDQRIYTPVECVICMEDILPASLQPPVWAPCCRRWYHRQCTQELALSGGFLFRCPFCNNVEKFKSTMLTLGIYIPARDASWETVPNAYIELEQRRKSCDALKCLCSRPEERKYHQEIGSWKIILCNACGGFGTHQICSSVKHEKTWLCTFCQEVTDGLTRTIKRRRLESGF